MDLSVCSQWSEKFLSEALLRDAYMKTVGALAGNKPIRTQSTNKHQIASAGNRKPMAIHPMASAGKLVTGGKGGKRYARKHITDGKRGKICNWWQRREKTSLTENAEKPIRVRRVFSTKGYLVPVPSRLERLTSYSLPDFERKPVMPAI